MEVPVFMVQLEYAALALHAALVGELSRTSGPAFVLHSPCLKGSSFRMYCWGSGRQSRLYQGADMQKRNHWLGVSSYFSAQNEGEAGTGAT